MAGANAEAALAFGGSPPPAPTAKSIIQSLIMVHLGLKLMI